MTIDEAFVQFWPKLTRYAQRFVNAINPLMSAEDLVMETYLKAKKPRSEEGSEPYSQREREAWFQPNDAGHALALFKRMLWQVAADTARSRSYCRMVPLSDYDCPDWGLQPDAQGYRSEIEDALSKLAMRDARAGTVVALKMKGKTDRKIAEELKVSFATIRRDWEFAREFLQNRLRHS